MDIEKLKRCKDSSGEVIFGLWANDIVRMEKRDDGWWTFQVPSREIGKTGYFEFRTHASGGKWHSAGARRTREHCRYAAEMLQSGNYVLQPATSTEEERIPPLILSWVSVSAEISQHPSVTGVSA